MPPLKSFLESNPFWQGMDQFAFQSLQNAAKANELARFKRDRLRSKVAQLKLAYELGGKESPAFAMDEENNILADNTPFVNSLYTPEKKQLLRQPQTVTDPLSVQYTTDPNTERLLGIEGQQQKETKTAKPGEIDTKQQAIEGTKLEPGLGAIGKTTGKDIANDITGRPTGNNINPILDPGTAMGLAAQMLVANGAIPLPSIKPEIPQTVKKFTPGAVVTTTEPNALYGQEQYTEDDLNILQAQEDLLNTMAQREDEQSYETRIPRREQEEAANAFFQPFRISREYKPGVLELNDPKQGSYQMHVFQSRLVNKGVGKGGKKISTWSVDNVGTFDMDQNGTIVNGNAMFPSDLSISDVANNLNAQGIPFSKMGGRINYVNGTTEGTYLQTPDGTKIYPSKDGVTIDTRNINFLNRIDPSIKFAKKSQDVQQGFNPNAVQSQDNNGYEVNFPWND